MFFVKVPLQLSTVITGRRLSNLYGQVSSIIIFFSFTSGITFTSSGALLLWTIFRHFLKSYLISWLGGSTEAPEPPPGSASVQQQHFDTAAWQLSLSLLYIHKLMRWWRGLWCQLIQMFVPNVSKGFVNALSSRRFYCIYTTWISFFAFCFREMVFLGKVYFFC